MITRLYKILYNVKNKKIELITYRLIKLFLNIFYPLYCLAIKKHSVIKEQSDVIISLTSFPARIKTVWVVIETLLRQSYKPYKVILWLANTQFDSLEILPHRLLKLQNRGLEIKFCEDLRSHKKYYYSMIGYPEHKIITVDDDTFYPENLIENLIKTSEKYPNAVCCNLAHVMTIENGKIEPYLNWISGADGFDSPSDFLVPIGCEGVLYPPKLLNENLFDKEQIKELCPLADDLWLKAMSTVNGVKAVKANANSIAFANLISSNKESLHHVNVGENLNDKQLEKIIMRYPQLKAIWR